MKRNDASHAALSEAHELGHEARAEGADHAVLKLWLRLLSCTTQIETLVRRRLRERFGISLARFDYLAQLHRHADGLTMRVLSRLLMVTGGNVTGLTQELEREGLVQRLACDQDRRVSTVRLTTQGRRSFEAMAREHEAWLLALFDGLDSRSIGQLHSLLGELRVRLVSNEATAGSSP